MTFNHTNAQEIANGGFKQRVPNPSTPTSNQNAGYYSAKHAVVVPIVFGTTSYSAFIPKGAIITDITFIANTAFSGGVSPSFQVGSAANGTDILGSTVLSTANNFAPKTSSIAASGQTFFVTITGGPTAGAGIVVLEYVNS